MYVISSAYDKNSNVGDKMSCQSKFIICVPWLVVGSFQNHVYNFHFFFIAR